MYMGIIMLTVTLVSFLVAITFSGSLTTNLVPFVLPLAIGVIFLVLLFNVVMLMYLFAFICMNERPANK